MPGEFLALGFQLLQHSDQIVPARSHRDEPFVNVLLRGTHGSTLPWNVLDVVDPYESTELFKRERGTHDYENVAPIPM